MLRVSFVALILISTCLAKSSVSRKAFQAENKDSNFKLSGYFEGRSLHIKYQIAQNKAPNSLMFLWRIKKPTNTTKLPGIEQREGRGWLPSTGNCPGFGIYFNTHYQKLKGKPKTHIAFGCVQNEAHDPEVKLDLAADFWERKVDKIENGVQYFEGTIDYQAELEKYSASKYDYLYVRGQGPKTEIQFEKFYDI